MDNAQVTEAEELFDAILGSVSRYAEWGIPEYREAALRTINDTLARHCLENADDEEETHKIGFDEGRQEMVREIDLATGGDGEFRYCMNGDPDRHCPDAEAMKARVLDRFAALHRLERSEPVGCQYPVHGSVTHTREVECCDFCGHPADTTTPEPVAEIERLRGALEPAFVTSVTEGNLNADKVRYKLVFEFRSLAELDEAHTAWIYRKGQNPCAA